MSGNHSIWSFDAIRGGANLTLGQIEFIKQWIIKGAPKTGSVVDETILANNAVCQKVFVPMQAPAAAEGFQLAINTFTVSPNTEREVFVNRNTPQYFHGLCK